MQSSPTSKMSALVFKLQALIKLLNIFIQKSGWCGSTPNYLFWAFCISVCPDCS